LKFAISTIRGIEIDIFHWWHYNLYWYYICVYSFLSVCSVD